MSAEKHLSSLSSLVCNLKRYEARWGRLPERLYVSPIVWAEACAEMQLMLTRTVASTIPYANTLMGVPIVLRKPWR